MRPFGSPKTLERRRRRAVARRVQASVSSVSQWRAAWQQGGDAALAPKPVPGPPHKLTAQQRTQLVQLLVQGARA